MILSVPRFVTAQSQPVGCNGLGSKHANADLPPSGSLIVHDDDRVRKGDKDRGQAGEQRRVVETEARRGDTQKIDCKQHERGSEEAIAEEGDW